MKTLGTLLLVLVYTALTGQDEGHFITYYKDSRGGAIVIGTSSNQPGIVCIRDARGNTVHYDLISPRNQQITMDAIFQVSNGAPVTLPNNYDRPITFTKQKEGKNGASSSPFGGEGWSFSGLKKRFFKLLNGLINKILSGITSNVKDGCGQLGEIFGDTYGGTYPVRASFQTERLEAITFDDMLDQVKQEVRR